jgi:multicomponent Na+:H+ antiporter subunit D
VPSLAPLPVVVPLLSAPAILAGRRRLPRLVVRGLALAAALTVAALGATLLAQAHGVGVYWFGGWRPRHGVVLGVNFAVDSFGAAGVLFAGALTAAVLLAAGSWPRFGPLAHVLTLVVLAAASGFCLTGDLFNMFVFFELMSVATIALLALDTGDSRSLRGALHFAISNSIGAFFVLIGIALLYARTGALNFAAIGQRLAAQHPDQLVVVAVLLLVVGFMIKAAIVPFHFWLVDAASSAPPPVSMLLVGLLDTLGVYAIARIYWTMFSSPNARVGTLQPVLIGAGVATALLGAVLCLSPEAPNRRLAFVAISHAGLMLVGVGLLSRAGLAGFAVYAIASGGTKAALFALATPAQARGWLGDRGRRALLVVAGLVLAGLPPAATWLGKGLLEDGATGAAHAAVVALVLAVSVLTAATVIELAVAGRNAPTGAPVVRTSGALVAGAILLAATVGLGLVPGLSRGSVDAAARFVDRPAYAGAVLGVAAGPAPSTTTHGLGATAALLGVASAAGALGLGVARGRRRAGRPAGAALARLAALHHGAIADSAAWITFGAATIGATLALAVR